MAYEIEVINNGVADPLRLRWKQKAILFASNRQRGEDEGKACVKLSLVLKSVISCIARANMIPLTPFLQMHRVAFL